MKLQTIRINNYRAIRRMTLPLDEKLTVFFGDNAHGKTSVLGAIAVGLGSLLKLLPNVNSQGFVPMDRRGDSPIEIELTAVDGTTWTRFNDHQGKVKDFDRDLVTRLGPFLDRDRSIHNVEDLPIVAFYDTDRTILEKPSRRRSLTVINPGRTAALEGSLSSTTDFEVFLQWFYARENEELRYQRGIGTFDRRLGDLNAVRRAMGSMVPEISDPRVRVEPFEFVVTANFESDEGEELSLSQLSGGYRIMVTLVADLAWRMAHGNPHLEDPLQSEAIVLIDEIELHLHPLWQQRVLTDLMRTFPNTQFIVTTHSPQILSTISPRHIVRLAREAGDIVAGTTPNPTTFGAKAGYVLDTVMGVNERPSGNEFVELLNQYWTLILEGNGESEDAKGLRRRLNGLSPQDPGLDRADMEIRRQKMLGRLEDNR